MAAQGVSATDFEHHRRWLERAWSDLREYPNQVTLWILFCTSLVFLGQLGLAFYFSGPVEGSAPYLFQNYWEVAWLLSPFLHRDLLHFLVNIVFVALLGTILERHFTNRQYWSFFLLSAALSSATGYAFIAPFAQQKAASYGLSGFGFALGGFAFYYFIRDIGNAFIEISPVHHGCDSPTHQIAAFLGLVSVAAVLANVALPPYATAHATNGAHLAGLLVGLLIGYMQAPNTDLDSQDER